MAAAGHAVVDDQLAHHRLGGFGTIGYVLAGQARPDAGAADTLHQGPAAGPHMADHAGPSRLGRIVRRRLVQLLVLAQRGHRPLALHIGDGLVDGAGALEGHHPDIVAGNLHQLTTEIATIFPQNPGVFGRMGARPVDLGQHRGLHRAILGGGAKRRQTDQRQGGGKPHSHRNSSCAPRHGS